MEKPYNTAEIYDTGISITYSSYGSALKLQIEEEFVLENDFVNFNIGHVTKVQR